MIDRIKSGMSSASGWVNNQQASFGGFIDRGLFSAEVLSGDSSFQEAKSKYQVGSQGAAIGSWRKKSPFAKKAFTALHSVQDPLLSFANSINQNLIKNGSGYAPGFKSLGTLASKMPTMRLGGTYLADLAMMTVADVGFGGKDLSLSTLTSNMWHSIPMTIGSELAGGGSFTSAKGLKSIATFGGYQFLGEQMGIGSWGGLGLQVLGSSFVPGLGMALGATMVGKKIGQSVYEGHKAMRSIGSRVSSSEFSTGDSSFKTAAAATMRQRSLAAIQKSQMNARSMLGREASIMMGR